MGTDVTDHIKYCAKLNIAQADQLGSIRLWPKIKLATEGENIWLSDLDYAQVHSLEIKSIPFILIYVVRENKLFPLNLRLPSRNFPSLLFTPIQRAIQVSLPQPNPNYFGLKDKVTLEIVKSDIEKETTVSIVKLKNLEDYLLAAPEIRLKKVKWAQLNNDLAILMGTPLLPLPGTTFYRQFDFLIPSGYTLSLSLLQDALNDKINPESTHWVLWRTNSKYALIEKEAFQPLSRSSFTLTQEKLLSE